MTPLTTLWVALAGGGGAVARFVVDGSINARKRGSFPWATLTINVTGSLLLGFLTGLVLFRDAPSMVTLVAGTGFCGGFTTFSTASVEAVRLLESRRFGAGVAAVLGTLALATGAAALGMWAGSAV